MVDEIKIGKGQLSIEKGVAPKSAFPVAVLSLGVYIYIFIYLFIYIHICMNMKNI